MIDQGEEVRRRSCHRAMEEKDGKRWPRPQRLLDKERQDWCDNTPQTRVLQMALPACELEHRKFC